MKIAMLGQKAVPSRDGGVEVAAERLAAGLARRGHRVVCYNRSGFSSGEKQYHGIRLVTVPALGKGGMGAVTASFFAACSAAFSDARVVHIHAEGPAFFSFLPKLTGKRVVVTIHGLDWKREKWQGRFASRFLKWGERMAVRYAHSIIVLSRSMQRYFLETYNRKTVWIPNGVDIPEPAEPNIIRQLGLEKDGYVLFLGRLVPEKGIHTLIDAWKQVNTGKKLVIAGASSGTDGYVRRLKEQAGENVLFPGFVEGRLLAELYSNAFLYVLPSSLEGMPVGLLEAMSYGCCCVVSDIPECAEVAGNCGILFPVGDAKGLAAVLQRFVREPERREQYAQAAWSASEGYRWEEIIERTLECYREDPADQ